MGVTVTNSTMPGAMTPICEECGVALCWDIAQEEYDQAPGFWDAWKCRDCNPNYRGSLQRYLRESEVKVMQVRDGVVLLDR